MFYIKTDDNVKIAVEDINPRAHNCVLFVHGWPLSRKIFEYQTTILPSCGYRVITMDIRGFGQSDCPCDGYSYDRLAKDLYTVIRNLRPKNLTLAGFSMGGAICIRYMANYNQFCVTKLALIAAAAPLFTQRPDYPYGMTKKTVNQLIMAAHQDRPQMVADFGANLFARPHSENLKTWFKQLGWSASGIGTIETAKSLRDEDLRDDLCKIHVPTGIFHGTKDKVCPYEFALLQHEGIENSELYTFEDSGHAVFYDDLEFFNRCFLHFLEC